MFNLSVFYANTKIYKEESKTDHYYIKDTLKYIKFLEDIFNIDSDDVNLDNDFEGHDIKPISLEKGNYEIIGTKNGDIYEGDIISFEVYLDGLHFFKVGKVLVDSESGEDKIYIEGIHKKYHFMKNNITRQKNEGDLHPIKINRASSPESPVNKSLEEIISYCFNLKFEKPSKPEIIEENKEEAFGEIQKEKEENTLKAIQKETNGNNSSLQKKEVGLNPLSKVVNWFKNNFGNL